MANQALGMAKRMASKKSAPTSGKCEACGSPMADGGIVEDMDMKNDGVDDYNPESIMDADGDGDDLEYSPEVGDIGVEDSGDDDGGDNEAKRANFLKAYLIHRKVRKG